MILIIDNYDSFTYNLYQLVAAIHPNVHVARNDAKSVDEIAALNPKAIIISPGPGHPYEAGICVDLIRKVTGKIPIFGVCLGHQALGLAFGAKITPAPNIVHGKSSLIFHQRKGLFQDIPLPFEAGRYHSLHVERHSLPSELEVLAETSEGFIMAMKHRTFPSYGVQFHPESILTPSGEKLLKRFLDLEVTP